MNEIWKELKEFPNYCVSNFGRVKSIDRVVLRNPRKVMVAHTIKGKILRPLHNNKNGYDYVCIKKGNRYYRRLVHRLVAIAFLLNPENKKEINHKNGIKTDNRVDNLEWATRCENIRHAFDNDLIKKENQIKSHKKYGKAVVQLLNGQIVRTFYSTKQAGRELDIYPQTIKWLCSKSQTHIYKGYEYRYAKEV